MSVPVAIEAALRRLASALGHLDAAAERRAQMEAARADSGEEFAIMRDDRSRLALELEGAMARLARMERAHDEALKRIDNASAAIQAALGEDAEEPEGEPQDGGAEEE